MDKVLKKGERGRRKCIGNLNMDEKRDGYKRNEWKGEKKEDHRGKKLKK